MGVARKMSEMMAKKSRLHITLFLTWCLITIPLLASVGATKYPSGFYYDNGMGQTEYEVVSLEDREEFESHLLTLLGLTRVPENAVHKVGRAENRNHTILLFMKDIANSLTKDSDLPGEMREDIAEEELRNNHFRITELDIKAINESDIIMSFANRGRLDDMQWTQLFWFDTTELPGPHTETILRAELRLYKGLAAAEFLSDPDSSRFIIKCYQLVEESTGEARLMDSMEVEITAQGWLIIDVTEAAKAWQLDSLANQGLMVNIVRKDDPNIQLHPTAVGLKTSRESRNDREPFMVGFLKSSEDSNSLYSKYSSFQFQEATRSKRSPRKSSKKSRKKKKKFAAIEDDFGFGGDNPYVDVYSGPFRNRHCQKRVFRVSFQDLGWEEGIIAPDDYQAFYCHGECSFPLNTHMNATNHAIVQTLVHLMQPSQVPKPCCAPKRLSAISVLYFDESSNVILKKYQNMVVKSCGCH